MGFDDEPRGHIGTWLLGIDNEECDDDGCDPIFPYREISHYDDNQTWR